MLGLGRLGVRVLSEKITCFSGRVDESFLSMDLTRTNRFFKREECYEH
jgi:hypothetical protein